MHVCVRVPAHMLYSNTRVDCKYYYHLILYCNYYYHLISSILSAHHGLTQQTGKLVVQVGQLGLTGAHANHHVRAVDRGGHLDLPEVLTVTQHLRATDARSTATVAGVKNGFSPSVL